MGKAARIRESRQAANPPVRRPTNAPTISRRWLYAGIGAIVAVVAVTLIVMNVTGGKSSSAPPVAIDGSQTAALLDGIPQSGDSLGSPNAPVVLYEFADLQCPYCQRYTTEVLPTVIRDYVRTGKVRIVWRGLTSIGPDSEKALRVALAAGHQNRLWNVADLFYHNQGQENTGWVTSELIDGILAAVPGLDAGKVKSAESSSAVSQKITAVADQATSAGINSTPTFLVSSNGKPLERMTLTALTVDAFRTAIAPYVK